MIPECYVPNQHIRDTRKAVRKRAKLVQGRSRVINRLRSMLDADDVVIDASSMYSPKALAQLDSVRMDSGMKQMMLEQDIREIRYFTDEISLMDKRLEREASQNKYARLLTSMSGAGAYTALLLAAEIADVSRFRSTKAMVSWAGLCPTVHQSGDKLYLGRMRKIDRSKLVNWIMCEIANVAVQHDARMKAAYEAARRRHADKHGPAIIVVANKMITIMWHILNIQTPYESRNESLYRRKLAKMDRANLKK